MASSDQDARTVVAPDGWADPQTSQPGGSLARRWLPLLTWLGCLIVAVVLLRWLGDGRLPTPPLDDPAAWWHWLTTGDPVTVAMGTFRVVALGLAWYLTGVTSISVVARLLDAASMVRLADALSVGPVRVLVQQAVGVGLAASVLATAVPSGVSESRARAAAQPDEVAVMVPIEEPEAVARGSLALRDPVAAPVPAPSAPLTASAADDGLAPIDLVSMNGVTAGAHTPSGPVAEADPEAGTARRERMIAAGDHFWSIAEDEVATQLGRPGTEEEVLDHWETLLVANADRLVVAGNADLLVPGQTIVLPAVEGGSS